MTTQSSNCETSRRTSGAMNQFDFVEVCVENGDHEGFVRGICVRGEHYGVTKIFCLPYPLVGRYFWTVERGGDNKIVASEKWQLVSE